MNNHKNLFEECRALCSEALQMKPLAKFKTSGGGKTAKWNIEIDGKLVGRIERHNDDSYEGSMSWQVFIYKPGTKAPINDNHLNWSTDSIRTYADDPNEAFKDMAKSSRTNKATIRAIEAHGVTINNLNKKHFKKVS